MGQTLTNGIYLPDEGERNSYSGLEVNWRTLDALILTVNGKAAPNVANTWTAAQTFTAGITGNVTGNVTGDLTGTASKAIADEDGTSIKTGYVNVAGNQTVSGQKTWSGNQFFTSPMYPKNTSYEIGNTPASNVAIPIYFTDKNNVYTGYVRSIIYTSGGSATEIRAKNTFKSGVLDPTGADISSNLNVEVQPNGAKTIYWDGLIRNDVTPFTTNNNSLGTSTNQWSSVYAQTYYYNGTQWGLDQNNTWTGINTFKSQNTNFALQSTVSELGSLTASSNWFRWVDKNGAQDAYISRDVWSDGADTLRIAIVGKRANGAPSTSGTEVDCGVRLNLEANGTKSFTPFDNNINLGSSTNKWKTLNGVNPGALSLPDSSNWVNIDTTNWNKTGADNSYTPLVDGWLLLRLDNTAGNYLFIANSGYSLYSSATGTGSSWFDCFMPVQANIALTIQVKGTNLVVARLIKCLGNV